MKGRKKWLIAAVAALVAVLEVVGPQPVAALVTVLGEALVPAAFGVQPPAADPKS